MTSGEQAREQSGAYIISIQGCWVGTSWQKGIRADECGPEGSCKEFIGKVNLISKTHTLLRLKNKGLEKYKIKGLKLKE